MTEHRVTVKERRDAIRTRSSSAQVEQFLPLGAHWSLLSLLGPTWDPDIVGPSFDIEMFYYSQAMHDEYDNTASVLARPTLRQ